MGCRALKVDGRALKVDSRALKVECSMLMSRCYSIRIVARLIVIG